MQITFPNETYSVWKYIRWNSLNEGWFSEPTEPLTTLESVINEVSGAVDTHGDDLIDIRVFRHDQETPRRDLTEDVMSAVVSRYCENIDEWSLLPELISAHGGAERQASLSAIAAEDARHVRQEMFAGAV